MSKRRVVVTGIGAISPLGVGADATWAGLLAGRNGIGKITRFDASEFSCQIAGEVKDFNPDDFIDRKEQKKMDLFIQYGYAASIEAVQDAGLEDVSDALAERIAVVLGSGIGGLPEIERTYDILKERGPRRVSPFFIPSILTNLLSGQVSIKYGFKGPNLCTVTACATGAHSIGSAMRMIQYGEIDAAVAGGAEASICPSAMAGFASAKALSKGYNDDPAHACRPFDENRDGFVMSEGAGVLVLEEMEHAKARGAKIYAEIAGFGQTGDAYHMTSPSADGEGGARAINLALKDAAMNADEVGYVNAHATSTPAGDAIESGSIERVFGNKITVSATKSMTGHMLGAAGGLEAAICALSMRDQKIAPTINLENPSEGCNLDYTPHTARDLQHNASLSNSFGFGGTNASLIFKKV